MKKILIYSFLVIFLGACKKDDKVFTRDTLNISGIKTGNRTEIINLHLKSGEVTSDTIDCYVFGSTFFDPRTNGFGYVNCDSYLKILNLQTGEVIHSNPLPGMLSQIVVDTIDNSIIGQYFENDSSYIVKVSLNDGTIIGRNSIDFGEGIFACTYFFKPIEREYIILGADSSLISINPDNGAILKSIKVKSIINNAFYDVKNNRLIGITYSSITDQNYIEVLNVETGTLINKVEIKERNDYYGCVSSFDSETNCFILVNSQNKILFIDIESGVTKDSYQIDFEIKEFKFWRGI